MTNNEYISPDEAAAGVYEIIRGPYEYPYDHMTSSSGNRSRFKRYGRTTLTQNYTVEFETDVPYQAYRLQVGADLLGDTGDAQVTMHGAGLMACYVFPADIDSLELWLAQFRICLRREFTKDTQKKEKTND